MILLPGKLERDSIWSIWKVGAKQYLHSYKQLGQRCYLFPLLYQPKYYSVLHLKIQSDYVLNHMVHVYVIN